MIVFTDTLTCAVESSGSFVITFPNQCELFIDNLLLKTSKKRILVIEWGNALVVGPMSSKKKYRNRCSFITACSETDLWNIESLYPNIKALGAPYNEVSILPQRASKGRLSKADVCVVSNNDLRSFHVAELLGTLVCTDMPQHEIYEYSNKTYQLWSEHGGFLSARKDLIQGILPESQLSMFDCLASYDYNTLRDIAMELGLKRDLNSRWQYIRAIRLMSRSET